MTKFDIIVMCACIYSLNSYSQRFIKLTLTYYNTTMGLASDLLLFADFVPMSHQMITLESSDSLDLIRTIRMASYGMVLSGPSLHLWFNFVARIIPKRDLISTLKKLFIGQTVYGPIMTSIFFSSNAAAQGNKKYLLCDK